jgi:hypothetical protein
MHCLWNLLDEDESGELDLREFLVGLALLADANPHSAKDEDDEAEQAPHVEGEKEERARRAKVRRNSVTAPIEELDAAAAEVVRSHGDAALRLAFDMFSVDGLGEEVLLADLRRVFKRGFPDVADFEVARVFADAEAEAQRAQAQQQQQQQQQVHGLPPQTPGGTQTVSLSFAEFCGFCRAHPECVAKFKSMLKHDRAAL